MSTHSSTPVEDTIRQRLTQELDPTTLEIHNDSQLHAHHKAMQDSTSSETHFRVVVTSKAFQSKTQPARHRMIYAILDEELKRAGGIHALQLKTQTPDEESRRREKGDA